MRRNKLFPLTSIALALLLLLSSCVTPLGREDGFETVTAAVGTEDTEEESTKKPAVPGASDAPDATYTYDAKIDESVLDTGYSARYLMLVNRTHPLTKDYKPQGLVKLTCHTTYEMELESRAAAALYQMLREMAADGIDVIEDVAVTSAYRSYRLQEELFAGYVDYELNYPGGFSPDAYRILGYEYIQKEYKEKGIAHLSEEDVLRVVSAYSADAGKSEHQTGLSVDFITKDMNNSLTVEFENKPVFSWLIKYAHTFGFILRFPKDKEDVTGYMYEPWHYRFVGREAATEIHERGITLEEYLGAA